VSLPPSRGIGNPARRGLSRGVCRTRKEVADKTLLLLMAAKGLMLKSRTREKFQADMARVLRATA